MRIQEKIFTSPKNITLEEANSFIRNLFNDDKTNLSSFLELLNSTLENPKKMSCFHGFVTLVGQAFEELYHNNAKTPELTALHYLMTDDARILTSENMPPPTGYSALDACVKTIAEFAAWDKQLETRPTINPNVYGYNLSRLDLSKAELSDVNLAGANLRFANLEDSNFWGVNLVGANLTNANLANVDFEGGANLAGAHLAGANLRNACLVGANFKRANLEGAYLVWIASLAGTNFGEANLTGAEFGETDMQAANFVDANLANVDLSMVHNLEQAFYLESAAQHTLSYLKEQLLSTTDFQAILRLYNKNLRGILYSLGTHTSLVWLIAIKYHVMTLCTQSTGQSLDAGASAALATLLQLELPQLNAEQIWQLFTEAEEQYVAIQNYDWNEIINALFPTQLELKANNILSLLYPHHWQALSYETCCTLVESLFSADKTELRSFLEQLNLALQSPQKASYFHLFAEQFGQEFEELYNANVKTSELTALHYLMTDDASILKSEKIPLPTGYSALDACVKTTAEFAAWDKQPATRPKLSPDIYGYNLSKLDLSKVDLAWLKLSGANFAGAKLAKANLEFAELAYTNFSNADLRGINLTRASLKKADLVNTNLDGAILWRTDLGNANLWKASFIRAKFEGVNFADANFEGADFEGAKLVKADLVGANLAGVKFERVDFTKANLEGANLKNANLDRAKFSHANLKGASLEGSTLRFVDLSDAELAGADFKWTNILCADFSKTDLSMAKNLDQTYYRENTEAGILNGLMERLLKTTSFQAVLELYNENLNGILYNSPRAWGSMVARAYSFFASYEPISNAEIWLIAIKHRLMSLYEQRVGQTLDDQESVALVALLQLELPQLNAMQVIQLPREVQDYYNTVFNYTWPDAPAPSLAI